jgi:hypothetical protein
MIAPLCPLDEVSLVHDSTPGLGAAGRSRSDGMASSSDKSFPAVSGRDQSALTQAGPDA